MKTCEVCGKELGKRKGKRFCSTTCRVLAFRIRETDKWIKELTPEALAGIQKVGITPEVFFEAKKRILKLKLKLEAL